MIESASKSGDPERVPQQSPEEWIATNGDAGMMRTSTPWCREPRGFRRPTARALSAACAGQIGIDTAIAEAEIDWARLGREGRQTGIVTPAGPCLPVQVPDISQFGVDPRPIGDTPGPAENSISTCGTIAQSPVTSASPEGV